MLLLALGVIVMSAGLAVIVLGAPPAHLDDQNPRSIFLRVAAGSAAMSLCSGVLYMFAYVENGEAATSTPAYTALVLSPALMCVALSSAHQTLAWLAIVFSVVIGLAVALSFTLLTPEQALPVLLTVMAVSCASCAVLAARDTALPHTAMRVLASGAAFYAVYCTARVGALIISGGEYGEATVLFGFLPSLLAALLAYVVVATAVVTVLFSATRAGRRRALTAVAITIRDWDLVVAAYGRARAVQMVDELRSAARDRDSSSSDIRRGVATTLPSPLRQLREALVLEYGWGPEQTGLVMVDAGPAE
ncbi:hypothetical protein [Microbacterium hydrothermale]|nr:hypothetical protein [Microbacterium hydrothermale]